MPARISDSARVIRIAGRSSAGAGDTLLCVSTVSIPRHYMSLQEPGDWGSGIYGHVGVLLWSYFEIATLTAERLARNDKILVSLRGAEVLASARSVRRSNPK